MCVCVCAHSWLPILPGGERLSSSLDGKVRGMTDFFPPSSSNDLSLQSPHFLSVRPGEWGKLGVWGGGLTSLIKSRLAYAVGRHQPWWREEEGGVGEAVSRMQWSQVLV